MRQIIVGFLIIGIYGIVNSLPAVQSSTPVFQTEKASTEQASTEKAVSSSSPVTSETKADKEIPIVHPSLSENVSPRLSEHGIETVTIKTVSDTHPGKTLDAASLPSKENEQTTSNLQKEGLKELTTLSPGHKVLPTITSPSGLKVVPTTVLPPVYKGEVSTTLPLGNKGQLTPKPNELNKKGQASNPNRNSTKTSTNYKHEGKVVIFNGICGPRGCEIEGDVYDELVPIARPKKQ